MFDEWPQHTFAGQTAQGRELRRGRPIRQGSISSCIVSICSEMNREGGKVMGLGMGMGMNKVSATRSTGFVEMRGAPVPY